MESQAQTTVPPLPLDLSAILRALKPGESRLFPTESATSVRALASRISRGAFKTRQEKDGLRVWRKPEQSAQADG